MDSIISIGPKHLNPENDGQETRKSNKLNQTWWVSHLSFITGSNKLSVCIASFSPAQDTLDGKEHLKPLAF
jgi:hypothetical protein